jgi:hypothetical protein
VISLKSVAIGLLALALTAIQAGAVPFTFSQGGWPGGGEITGSFDLNFDCPTPTPGILYVDALTDFSAHWSGNLYTQPYDWSLTDVNNDFVFGIGGEAIIVMTLGGVGPDSVYYDATLPLIWDDRPSHIDINPDGDYGRYRSTAPLVVNQVPDENSTLLLLGSALISLVIMRAGLTHQTRANRAS